MYGSRNNEDAEQFADPDGHKISSFTSTSVSGSLGTLCLGTCYLHMIEINRSGELANAKGVSLFKTSWLRLIGQSVTWRADH
ncbi:MAG: hypothetical protein RL693_2064, partial [Verrucomicrobiota bacterium]